LSILKHKKFDKIKVSDFFECIPVGIAIAAPDGSILYGNSISLEILGFNSLKELAEIPAVNFFCNPKDWDTFVQLQKKGYVKNFEVRVKKKDGTKICILVNSIEKKIGGDTFYVNTFQDITKRKLENKKIKEKYSILIESSNDGILLIDSEWRYIMMNDACAAMAQMVKEDLIGKKMTDVFPGVEYTVFGKNYAKVLETGISSKAFDKFTYPDEREVWYENHVFPVPEGLFIILSDVTEMKNAEELVIKENIKLQELSQMRQELITRISHELKTPLTSIYGASQAFLEMQGEDLNEEILEYREISYRGCVRLKELIDNLLDVSRLDSKKFELKTQKENLGELIKECVSDMNYLVNNRKQTLKADLPMEIFFKIDKLRLSQAIINLISNAIKNTPREGNIFVNLMEEDDFIDIQVRDTGVGLTKKEKERLFEKFGKIERYGKDLDVDIEGCGLGLYISREIVELHGGQIFVESEGRNEGATFSIRLFKNLRRERRL